MGGVRFNAAGFDRAVGEKRQEIKRKQRRIVEDITHDLAEAARTNAHQGDEDDEHAGRLKAGIREDVQDGPQGPSGRVSTDVPEGLYTEFGTSQMQARPWMRPAMYETAAKHGAEVTR